MKKSKFLLVALLSALTVSGCKTTTSSSTVNNSTPISSVDKTSAIIEEITARIVFLKDKQEVVDDFEVPSVVKFAYEGTNVEVNITWTADKTNVVFEEVDGKLMGKLTRPEMNEEPVEVKLTASFTYEGKDGSKGFRVTVMPKTGAADVWGEEPQGTPMTWSEFRAAENGSIITVKGRVIAWTYDEAYGNGNVFLQDENGGYYAYRLVAALSEYQDYLAVGNEVILEGQKDVYSGLHQFAQKSVTGIKVVSRENAGSKPEARDVTEAAKNGELEPLQSTWATVLGTYVIGDDGYKYIQVGGNRYQIYSDKKYNGENLEEVNAQLAGLTAGDTIRLNGIVGMYNNPQFYPYNVVKSDETITVSPEEKVAIAKADVFAGFEAKYEANAEVALYASSDAEVSVSYALNAEANTSVYALSADKLTITPSENEEKATVTATISCGAVTDTATFEITAMLPSTDVDSYVLTAENLGLGAYAAGTKTVNGIEWGYTELGSYGDGIQMRIKEGRTASLWNNTATARPIKEIRLTYSDTKSTYDNTAAFDFDFGTSTAVDTYKAQLDTVKNVKEYVVTPNAETYTHFKMTLNLTFSFYWKSIEVVLADETTETPDTPDVPVETKKADFDTIVTPKVNGDSSYSNSYTTASGWVTANSAIQAGGPSNSNPQFTVIGEDNTHKAVCMNGKVSAPGSITSPTLNGGVSKIDIDYTKMFTDTVLSCTVTVTEIATGNVYTHVISAELPKDEKYVVYNDEWTLETPVTGDFTIVLTNNCPSQNTGNKDRMTILSIEWQ